MQKTDLPELEKALMELAECFDRKPPTAAAVKGWFEDLAPFPWHKVEYALRDWRRTKNKFPAVADIFLPLNEKSIDDREARWQAMKDQEKREVASMGKNPQGRETLKLLRAFLTTKVKPNPNAWAYRILDAYADNQPLNYTNPADGKQHPINQKPVSEFQLKMACEALNLDYNAIRRKSKTESGNDEEVAA